MPLQQHGVLDGPSLLNCVQTMFLSLVVNPVQVGC